MDKEKKERLAIWIYPSVIERMDEAYKQKGCKSQSEFIERAIEFYIDYINTHKKNDFLPLALTSVMEGTIENTEDRLARLLFKLSVETSMMMNIVASSTNLNEASLVKLRGKCINDVKHSNGRINFDDIYKYQKGM